MYPTSYDYFYSTASQEIYSSYQMEYLFGIEIATTDITILNLLGYYPVVDSSPNFDLNLYTATSVWTLVPISGGEGATLVWTAVPKPLPVAKNSGRAQASQASDTSVSNVITGNYLTADVLSSVASQALVDRPAFFQGVLDETVVLTNALAVTLDAISAATTVDEINNIVNPPTGILFTGRGSGLGPLDLNVSYYTLFNSVSMTEAETELYVPGTSTVIAYGSYPGGFDSAGNCFTLGNYLLQIREVATGSVIAEFECPLNPAGENVSFNGASYNPTPPTPLSVTSGSIAGTAQVGSTLTYTPGVASGGVAPLTTTWVWKSGTTTVGTPSASTYVPVAGDVGAVITVVITAIDSVPQTATATTAPTAAVTYSSTTFNVTNNGSGNYVINGASNPTLTLAGGITYTFNISAPDHPFWIKTTQTTGTGDQYNTGVTNNGTDNGVITFVAPLTVEAFTLYYNCQYHASMAGVLNMLP